MKNILLIITISLLLFLLPSFSFSECIEGDCQNGQGTYTFSDGKKYVGEFKDERPNGQGTFTFPDGRKHVGEFKDGRPNGQGIYSSPNGEEYIGEYKNGNRNGQGTYTYSNGSVYVGEFENRKKHGQGTFTFPNGRKYVGEFKDGKPNGQGTLTYPDGTKYEGEWKDGKKYGQGTFTTNTIYTANLATLQNEVEELSLEYIDTNLDASSFMLDENYGKAIDLFTTAMQQNQKLTKAYQNMLGFLKQDLSALTTEEKSGFLNILKEYRQGYVSTFSSRGNCYSLSGQDELALEDYATAIKLAPKSGEAYYHRSMHFVKKGELEKAKADSITILEVAPGSQFAMMAQMMLDMYQ